MSTNYPAGYGMHGSKPAAMGAQSQPSFDVKVPPVEGGVTIAALVEQREKLVGTEVKLRGKVTKYTANIMNANWLHIMDGSDKRDLVVTTKESLKVGDTVVVKGRLERDVDIGAGYSYDLIIRGADVTVE